jgi:hypothetical protein
LSQVIQGTYLDLNNNHYILLQIHNWCDVRGGYTDAKLFLIDNDLEWFLNFENVAGTCNINGKNYYISNMYDGVYLRIDDDEGELQNKKLDDLLEEWYRIKDIELELVEF